MTTLAAVLVRQRSAPLETVEQAMLRQSLFGGDLATNLLELQCIDEQTLLSAQAIALECPAMDAGRIGTLPDPVRGLLPASLLTENQCVLIRLAGGAAELAIAAPLTPSAAQEISRRLGASLSFRAALEVRIQQSLAENFGVFLDARTKKLLARLDGIAYESLAPPSLPPQEPLSEFAMPESSEPTSQVPTPRVPHQTDHRLSNVPSPAKARGQSLKPTSAHQTLGVRPRRLGPFTAAMAEGELSQATTPGEIIEVWIDFASQYFEYTAVFAIQGDLAAGKLARGQGTTGEPFSRIGVPLDLPSALDRARRSTNWLLTALEPRGLDRNLARDLGRSAGPQVLLLPVSVRNRVVLVTYGDHGSENVQLDRVGDLLALRPLVERHLERLLVERKRERSLAPPARGPSMPAGAPQTSVTAERPVATAKDVVREDAAKGSEATAASKPPTTAPYHSAPPADAAAETKPPAIDSAAPTRPTWNSDLPTAPALDPVYPDVGTALNHERPTALEPADFPNAHGGSASHAAELLGSTPPRTAEVDDSWDLIQPVVAVGDAGLPRDMRAPLPLQPSVRPPSSPPGSVWPSSSTRPGISPKLELVSEPDPSRSGSSPSHPATAPDDATRSSHETAREVTREITQDPVRDGKTGTRAGTDELPAFRAESHPAIVPLPPSQSQEMALPTVLVDYDSDCMELIRRLSGGDATALEQLVELGDAAIGVLVREMPGPTTTPSRAHRGDPLVKASECGPILRALAAFGPAARPYVIARASDGDPKVRSWAVRLLGELGGRPSAAAVAQRVFLDKDAEVRRAAHLSCQLLYRDPDSAQALRQALLECAFDKTAVITHRLAAIDALSDLRDVSAIPRLIELLTDPNPGAAAGAQQALVVLARQDFGYDVKNWQAFWAANASRERIEWVIDALEHRQSAIRQAAAEELRLMSRIYVGGEDDDSLEARAKIQKKYRDWWASGGRQNSLLPKV